MKKSFILSRYSLVGFFGFLYRTSIVMLLFIYVFVEPNLTYALMLMALSRLDSIERKLDDLQITINFR